MKEYVLRQPTLCKLLCKAESESCSSQLHYWCRLLLPRWVCLCVHVRPWTCTPVSHCLPHLCCSVEGVVCSCWCRFTSSPPLCTPSCSFSVSFVSPTCINASPLPPPPLLSLMPSFLTNRCSRHHVGGNSSSPLWKLKKKETYFKQREIKRRQNNSLTLQPQSNACVEKVSS